MAPAPLSTGYQAFPPLPTIKLGPSGAGSWVGGLVHTVGLSNDLSCEAGSLSCCRPNHLGAFNQRLEALFPHAGALGYAVCLAPSHSSRSICARVWGHGVLPAALPAPFSATLSPALSVYLCANVRLQGLLVVGLPAPFVPHSASLGPWVCSALAARVHPSYRSGRMSLFYLLGVGLPCCSIFCQFWLCEEAQCVYLCLHLGSPDCSIFLIYGLICGRMDIFTILSVHPWTEYLPLVIVVVSTQDHKLLSIKVLYVFLLLLDYFVGFVVRNFIFWATWLKSVASCNHSLILRGYLHTFLIFK